jgi:NAD(P)-dependent dehydrogenase (short-subunit alcohol dehydrogenase family)
MTSDEAGENFPHQGPLHGKTVIVLGGSSGIGLAIARQTFRDGARVIITGRDAARLEAASAETGATASNPFDITDRVALAEFFDHLSDPVDHIFVGGSGPYYAPLADIDLEKAGKEFSSTLLLMIGLAQIAPPKMRAGGTLLFMGGTGARQPAVGLTVIGALIGAANAAIRNLALEIAPARINMIAAGFVDTPLSARLLGDGLDARRKDLERELPIRRVVQPEDVAALAIHLMTNTAITGGIFDIDGGQQVLPSVGA